MRVTVTRSGGFAGLTRVWSVRIEEQPDEAQWRELLEQLPWDSADESTDDPDRFVYRVNCESRESTISEQNLSGPWRELVEKVQSTENR